MAWPAKPIDQQWLAVVWMMLLGVRISAVFARPADEFAPLLVHLCVATRIGPAPRLPCQWVRLAPLAHVRSVAAQTPLTALSRVGLALLAGVLFVCRAAVIVELVPCAQP